MKVNLLNTCGTIILVIVIITGCKKGSLVNFPGKNSCRLVDWHGLDDGYDRSLHYNDKGLVDQWHEVVPAAGTDEISVYEYDRNNRVTVMNYYDHGVLSYTVTPLYKNGRVTEELWYQVGNDIPIDTVVNTYKDDRIVKRASLVFEYYVAFTYDAIGDVLQAVTLGDDGTFYDSTVQGFDKPVREPMVAAPGPPYPITYMNYMISALKYTQIKDLYYDADGNVVTAYEIDPAQSVLQSGAEGYATYYQTFDIISGTSNRQVWDYDNCDGDNKDKQNTSPSITDNSIHKTPGVVTNNNVHRNFLTVPEMRERVIQHRKLKLIKNNPQIQ